MLLREKKYEIIFALLKESLFGVKADLSWAAGDIGLWREVYHELGIQTVLGLTAPVIAGHDEIPERFRGEWSGLQKTFAIRYVQMAVEQERICSLLADEGIAAAVLKGMAAAIYYPVPEYRSMGDVDLLVRPGDFDAAMRVLKDNGYVMAEEKTKYHAAFEKYRVLFEVHRSPAGLAIAEEGEEIAQYILSGMDFIRENDIGQDAFPILPWKQNGMELIWHIRQHLYNGLGLRQIIDWMMFAYYYLDDERMREYMSDLRRCGMDRLAIVVTKMCQKYLGLPSERITWCEGADDRLCDDLMEFILGQGNFGIKAMNEKTAKVLSGYSTPIKMLKKLQCTGEEDWGLLERFPRLRPMAFLYGGVRAVRMLQASRGGFWGMMEDFHLGRRRKKMFSQLYGGKVRQRGLLSRFQRED